MGITTRYTQSSEEAEEILREALIALQGEAGETGLEGPEGPEGPPGPGAVELPVKYITANSGTVILSAAVSRRFRITIEGNITIKFSGFTDGMKFSVSLTQGDGGGNTVTWPVNIRWGGGAAPTLTATDDKRDTLGFERFKANGADSYDGFVIGQNI